MNEFKRKITAMLKSVYAVGIICTVLGGIIVVLFEVIVLTPKTEAEAIIATQKIQGAHAYALAVLFEDLAEAEDTARRGDVFDKRDALESAERIRAHIEQVQARFEESFERIVCE